MNRPRHRTSDPPLGSAKLGHISLSLLVVVSHEFHHLVIGTLSLSNASVNERLSVILRAVPGKVALVTVEGDTPRNPDGKPVAVLRFEVPGVAL